MFSSNGKYLLNFKYGKKIGKYKGFFAKQEQEESNKNRQMIFIIDDTFSFSLINFARDYHVRRQWKVKHENPEPLQAFHSNQNFDALNLPLNCMSWWSIFKAILLGSVFEAF